MTAPHTALAAALNGTAFRSAVIVGDTVIDFSVTGVVRVRGRVIGHVDDGTDALVQAYQAVAA